VATARNSPLALLAMLPFLIAASAASSAVHAIASPAQPPAASPASSVALLDPPTRDGRPVDVSVGLFFLNLVSLDEVVQSFSFTGYLYAEWNDYRLALPDSGPPRRYAPGQIWMPYLEFDNAASPRNSTSASLVVAADGTVHYSEAFTATLSSNLNMRPFPFDEQDLFVVIHPFVSRAQTVALRVNLDRTGISAQPYSPLPLWSLGRLSYDSAPRVIMLAGEPYSTLEFRVKIRRHAEFYVWKIFLPLFLMVVISWTVLWIPPADLNNQLLISVTTILTLIAFSFTISPVLPRVPHLTFYDVYFLICYVFVLMTVGEVMTVHLTHQRRTLQSAMRIRSISRYAMPLGFFLSTALAVFFFRLV
jgi:hypothetical protein